MCFATVPRWGIALILSLCCSLPVFALSTSAQSVILMEQESGRVLYEHNAHQEQLIASITKLLTALVALETNKPLDEMVTITEESCQVEGSSLYLTPQSELTLETLLYGMLLHSGNDAATAIAIHCAGSLDEFVAMMNEKAAQLGMTHSSFANPHGLNEDSHYSTAYDMALVAQACLNNEVLAQMVATPQISLGGRTFTNKNKLLSTYDGCVGMKTGYTELAGRTLVSAASRDGMTLICVTLNDRNDWLDHSNLFDYGFATYQMEEILPPQTLLPLSNHMLSFATVGLDTPFRYPIKTEELLTYELSLPSQTLTPPIDQGQSLSGHISWALDGTEVANTPLVSLFTYNDLTVEKESLWQRWNQTLTQWFHF